MLGRNFGVGVAIGGRETVYACLTRHFVDKGLQNPRVFGCHKSHARLLGAILTAAYCRQDSLMILTQVCCCVCVAHCTVCG